MKYLIKFFLFFTAYVNLFEWRVDRFFKSVKSSDSILSIKFDLLKLMKKNLIVVNIWMEKKYKGYKYLKKSSRRKMYLNALKIGEKLNNEIFRLGIPEVNYPGVSNNEKSRYLAAIMRFLTPGKYYKYIKTTSFGKLLNDPDKALLEGDCNQIVTLYAYLYSLKFPIDDLQIKLLPEHVCLHFQGVDIEATNAQFANYKNYTHILPVTEILSTNLLDLSDFREKVSNISPRIFVKSAQLAYAISSLKEIVDKNLQVAYQNLTVEALNIEDFSTAIFYSEKMRDKSLLAKVRYNQGVTLYKNQQFEKALSVFKELKDEKMQKACYSAMYNLLVSKVKNVNTVEKVRANRHIYLKMLNLAEKMEDHKLVENIKKMLKN